jgi:predicted RNase H-like HicB family nuclease
MIKNDYYTYRVTWSEDDHEYVGLCAEFSSMSWMAKAPEAASRGIRKVVAGIAKDMKADGEIPPEVIFLSQSIPLLKPPCRLS